MILDPNKIKQNISGETLIFEYPLEFKGVEKTAKIENSLTRRSFLKDPYSISIK